MAKELKRRETAELAKLSLIRRELVEARTVPEFKGVRDKAELCRRWAARQGASFEVVYEAAWIKLDAERATGKALRELVEADKLHKGGRPNKNQSVNATGFTLDQLGIRSRDDSRQWQGSSEVPTRQYKSYLKECKQERQEPTSRGVYRLAVRNRAQAKLDGIASGKTKAPKGKYDVIVIDPPWPMKKIEREVREEQDEKIDYPVMSREELEELPIPAADDCHLWIWTTHRFLPMAFELLQTWEFKYICAFVWNKAGGFQPIGLPQYNCEFALYARQGFPVFVDTKKFKVCFNGKRRKHSEKPSEFYEMIRNATGGRRLDMFNRAKLPGFDGWGLEAPKCAKT